MSILHVPVLCLWKTYGLVGVYIIAYGKARLFSCTLLTQSTFRREQALLIMNGREPFSDSFNGFEPITSFSLYGV